ncbi:MAG: amidohydrolase family protein [bacterium]|nr:amidohydrolase family protein [bacterium]
MRKTTFFTVLALVALLAIPQVSANDGSLLLTNANIITVAGSNIEGGDILIEDGIIKKIGTDLKAPKDARVIDLAGDWAMPGIIDSHSHIALEGNLNETGTLMTPETDCADVVNPEDMSIFYALTGGVTSVHTMHGSANPIGGRGIVLKLKWGVTPDEMVFDGAPQTVKWALGENPKQANSSDSSRYPKTRMGVEASIRAIFEEAKVYQQTWDDYNDRAAAAKKARAKAPMPPRKDIRLEVVSQILSGDLWVRCHAYMAPEMLSILRMCQEYDVKLAAFEHGLEAYKIADEIAEAGVGNAAFADFWGYKWEAFFTMPHSVAMQVKRGVVAAVSSDSPERIRRLNLDAAKTMRFGGLSEDEAIKTVTLFPAKICGTDEWVGTLEVGKHADIAVFNKHPLDAYTVCEMTLVDGKVEFDRQAYLEERRLKAEAKAQAEAEAAAKAEADKLAADEETAEEPKPEGPGGGR